MWIEELHNGKFKYVERYTDPLTGKTAKVSLTHIKRNNRVEKEMQKKLQEKIEAKLSKTSADINFKELTQKWLAIYKKQVRLSTYNNNVSYVNTINKEIGPILLKALTSAHINSVILHLFEIGYVYDTVKGMTATIRKIVNFGLKYGFIADRNILHEIELPRINVTEKDEFKYLERKELKTVVAQLEKKNYGELGRMCLIQSYTGMRYGEMISLDYTKHINFQDKTILIERTWYHRKRMFQPTKGGKPRTIHFNVETEKLLREQIRHTKIKSMQLGLDKNQRLLFVNGKSEPFTNSYANELLGKYTDIPGKRVTTHIFRHTFISLMVEQGHSSNIIAKHVGHTNTDMIEKVYSHFTNKMDEDLTNAIDGFSLSI